MGARRPYSGHFDEILGKITLLVIFHFGCVHVPGWSLDYNRVQVILTTYHSIILKSNVNSEACKLFS